MLLRLYPHLSIFHYFFHLLVQILIIHPMLYLLNHFVIKIIVIQHYFFIYLEIFQHNIVFVLVQHLLNYHRIIRMHFQMHELKLNYKNEIKDEKNLMNKLVRNRKLLLKKQRQMLDNNNVEESNNIIIIINNNSQEQHLNHKKLVLESDVCTCFCVCSLTYFILSYFVY